jgi:hypothetical protein
MKIALINSVSLPIKTGPSFTAIERARYLASQGHFVTLYFPYLYSEKIQEKVWGRTFSPRRFLMFLKKQYGVIKCKNINIKLFDSRYSSIYRWFTIKTNHLSDIYRANFEHVIFEDPTCHLFLQVFNFTIVKRSAIKTTFIHHTDFFRIVPAFWTWMAYQGVTRILTTFDLPNVHHILLSKAFIPAKAREHLSYSVLPVHAVRESFYDTNELPMGNGVYFMGKLDDRHKQFTMILDWTKEICDLNVYGEGKDEKLLDNYERCIYHGSVDDVKAALLNHSIYISATPLEGICTTTAEALVMNKYALILEAECNEVFRGMSNVVFFKNESDFKDKLIILLKKKPQYEVGRERFSWKSANEVFYNYFTRRVM